MEARQENKHLKWVEQLTWLMDSQFRLPGTNFRFGLDPLLGLVPFLGDAISLIISVLLVSSLWRYKSSGEVKARLILNILLDFALGSIPFVGSILDFFLKANARNLALVKGHFEEGKYQGNSSGIVWQTLIVLILLVGLIIWGMIALLMWVWELVF